FTQHLLLPVREKLLDAAMGTRFGRRGHLTVLGGMLSYQQVLYPGDLQTAEGNNFDQRVAADSASRAAVVQQTEPIGSLRLGLVLGQRNLVWVKKRGLDSMRGQQDVP